MPDDDPVLNTAKCARRVGRCDDTIRRWTNLPKNHPGYLKSRKIGGPMTVLLSDLNDCLRRREAAEADNRTKRTRRRQS